MADISNNSTNIISLSVVGGGKKDYIRMMFTRHFCTKGLKTCYA